MGIGTRSGSVVALQTFLNSWGYMSYASTGYFGPITYGAVVRFQAAHGIPTTGFVGPLTRGQIATLSCGNVPPPTPLPVTLFTITPSSAPVGATVTVTGRGFTANNVVHFAGGAIGNIPSSGGIAIACTTDPSCVPGIRQTLTFTIPSYIGPYCAPGAPCPMYATRIIVPGTYPVYVTNENGTSNSVDLTITGGTIPPSGVSISSVTPTSGPVGTSVTIVGTGFTNDNTVYLANGAIQHIPSTTIYNYSGIVCNGYPNCSAPLQSLTFTMPSAVGPYCIPPQPCAAYLVSITPGTYSLVVGNDTYGKSSAVSFVVTPTTTGAPLSISGIDAPNQLSMNVSGTWTVHTNSNQSGTLHYSVVWGDESFTGVGAAMASAPSIQGSATFTHTYYRSGTFNPTFTVTDDFGHTATISASVFVTPIY